MGRVDCLLLLQLPEVVRLALARIIVLVCLIALVAGAGPARARELGQPYFQTIPGTESIANGVITIISQDRRGLIWLGTPEGLYSYDGQRLRAYRNQANDPASLSDDYVRALLPHSDGRLWVATQGGGVSVYDPRTDHFTQYRPQANIPGSLPNIAALALAEAPDGDVWIGFGNRGMARWDHVRNRFEAYPDDPGNPAAVQHGTVRCLLFDRVGDLWIGTGDGLQRRRVGASGFERVVSEPAVPGSFAGSYVYALFEASDGRIWIGTQSQGAAVLDPRSGLVRHFGPDAGGTSHPWVSGFAEPTPGRIFIHTYGGGIDVVDADSDRIIQRNRSDLAIPGGLTLDRLTAPYKDRSGTIWIGTWGAGAQIYNPGNAQAFRTLRSSSLLDGNGLSIASVLSTLPIDDRRVWVGTGGNGIDVLDLSEGVIAGFRPDASRSGALRDGTIRALVKGADGSVWVGTQQAGLQRYDPTTQVFSEPIDGIPRAPVRQILVSRSGDLVVGMQAALYIREARSGAVRRMFLAPNRPFTDAVWSLAEGADGTLWVGTPNGLWRWPPGSDYPGVIQSQDFELHGISDLHFDASGQLWASGPRGIARLRAWIDGTPEFEDFGRRLASAPQGLGQQVLPDHQGRLWSSRAIIDPSSLQVEAIGVADGVDIGSVEIGSGSASAQGLLFFGGTRGLLIIDPARYRARQEAPPLLLTSIAIDDQLLAGGSVGAGVQVLPGQRRLGIEFAALDYADPGSVRYGWRLLGLDENWIEADASGRSASFYQLWPRAYQLEVRARSRNGPWGSVLTLPVTVLPAWWQTGFAWILALLLLVGLIYGAGRLRTLKMRQRAGALEALVERRTRELSLAKDSAEVALAELKGAQRQLVAAEKMASLGQLVAGVAHEINTPVGIAITAASHLQELAAEGNAKLADNRLSRADLARWKHDVEEAARLIQTSLSRAGTLIASFKQVSVDQSSGHRRTFLLQDFLQEVQTALNPSLRRTPHTLQITSEPGIELDSYPGALFQILTNLINNALLHAFAEGTAGHLRVQAQVEETALLLRFADDGQGMPAEVAARAFDPFFTTRRGRGGSGLGLHVVHNLVTQLLGGSVELHTAPGQGTQFVLRFPLVAPKPIEPSAEILR